MYCFIALRRLLAWIAVIAILGGTIAPAISHALAQRNGATAVRMQICTAHGMKLVATDARGESQPALPGLHPEHCPFCVLDATALPPEQKQFFLFPVNQAGLYPSLFFSAPRPLPAWSAANPRAPPTLS